MRVRQHGSRQSRPLPEPDRPPAAEAVAGAADRRHAGPSPAAVSGPAAAPGPAGLLALQRTAGNAAVVGWLLGRPGQPRPTDRAGAPVAVQRWVREPVPYYGESREGDDAYEARRAQGQLAPEVNMGVLYEGGHPLSARPSADLHCEELLIGARVLELDSGLSAADLAAPHRLPSFARYKTAERAKAGLYTERAPCPGCRRILDSALRDDDVVSYTVPFSDSAQMTAAVAAMLRRAEQHDLDEAVRRETEIPEAAMDAELDAAMDRLVGRPARAVGPASSPGPSSPNLTGPLLPSPVLPVPAPVRPASEPALPEDRRIRFNPMDLGVTQPIAKPPVTKVRCPVCGHPVARKKGGRLRKHNNPSTKRSCAGTDIPVTWTGARKYQPL